MQCKACNGTGKIKVIDFAKQGWKDTEKVCPICYGRGVIKQTNEEWFDDLSTEEKAKWLYDHYVNARAEEFYGRPDKEEAVKRWNRRVKHDN